MNPSIEDFLDERARLQNVLRRPDGRPEVYDIPPGTDVQCEISRAHGIPAKFKEGEIVMTSPADSSDGKPHFVHTSYLPENVVIYNPKTGTCRNKSGDHEWREDK